MFFSKIFEKTEGGTKVNFFFKSRPENPGNRSRPVPDPDLPKLNPVPSRDKKHTPKNTPPPKFLYP